MTLSEKIFGNSIGAFVLYAKSTVDGSLVAVKVDPTSGALQVDTEMAAPTGMATEAKQDTQKTAIDAVKTAVDAVTTKLIAAPATEAAQTTGNNSLSSIDGKLAKGDQLKAASLSVTPGIDIPAGRPIGKVTLDGPTAPIPVAISFASADAQTIIAAPSAGNRIRITKLWLSCSANFIIQMISGSTTIGNLYGMGVDMDFIQPLTLNTAEAFKLDSNIATQTYGGVCYYVDHLSTFATDVDTGSYTLVRSYLNDGHTPPEDAVRVEEFVNYFKYDYPAPYEDDFAVYAEAAPWSFGEGRKNSYLLRLGLKGREVSEQDRKPAILTFVIDVSGSMNRENRLELVKKSLRLLIRQLRPEDRIGIAIYGSRGQALLPHKGLYERSRILAAIDSLQPSGSTFAEEGIRIGYEMADRAYRSGYINRVILCSDGVANVGRTGADEILKTIKEKADMGITLTTIGFGMGNYNDVLMEQLSDKGNGNYIYIDTLDEARRVFENDLTGTLEVIARDVKVQVDFNPKVVRSYRLIGYENRNVPDDRFRDDRYDGGEVGAGHSVTALYELKLWPGSKGVVATTYVRYKDAETMAVREFRSRIHTADFNRSLADSSRDFRLAATVAELAEILRKSYWAEGATLGPVLEQARQLRREFHNNTDVIELVDLISKAKQLIKETDEPQEETNVITED